MTSVMISISTLSIFHSFKVTYRLAFHMVFISHSWLETHDAAHITMTLDITINFWLIGFCLKAKYLRNSFEKFYGRYPALIDKYQRSFKECPNDSFPSWFHAVIRLALTFFCLCPRLILSLSMMGIMHEADIAYSIRNSQLCHQLVQSFMTPYSC